jgi:hypothetical protein
MKNIGNQLVRVESMIKSSGIEFFGNKHKIDREWWVLGRTFQLMKNSLYEDAFFAESNEPPSPEFSILKPDGSISYYVEIAESIEDGRRRHDEMKDRLAHPKRLGHSVHVVEDPFISLRKLVLQKIRKPYASGCTLVVYFSIMGLQMADFYSMLWSQMVFREVDSWTKNEICPKLNSCPFDRIMVLDSSGVSLVQIFPKQEVIVEKDYLGK